jgi:hypothetical protein
MEKPTLYKKVPLSDVRTRDTFELSTEEKSSVANTVNKFFELFKIKHLG